MILPVIILMMSFMLLIASYFFPTTLFYFSLTKNQYQQVVNFQKAQFFLSSIMNEMEMDASCEIPFQSNAQLIDEPLSWWQIHACAKDNEVYYVYMLIQEAPCDFLLGHSVSYVEVLVRAGNKRKRILGALIALPSQKSVICTQTPRNISKKLLGEFLLQ